MPDARLYAIARDDDYFLGVLHSRIHEVWSLATSSRHGVGNDPTYNNTTCFETFPFPWPPGHEPADDPRVQAIAAAAKDLDDKRDAWLNPPDLAEKELKKRTLTNLYNDRPTWLDLLHNKLDEAVFAAYGWPPDLDEQEILERLLALNLSAPRPAHRRMVRATFAGGGLGAFAYTENRASSGKRTARRRMELTSSISPAKACTRSRTIVRPVGNPAHSPRCRPGPSREGTRTGLRTVRTRSPRPGHQV